jgi:hypothetical protein
MASSIRIVGSCVLAVLAVALAGCEHQGVVRYGDARAVAIEYYGDNVEDANGPAREYCAEYGRIPHFVASSKNIAYFDCASP